MNGHRYINPGSVWRLLFPVLLTVLLNPVITPAAPAPLKRLGFAIQMGAFSDVKNAERFAATLQAKGIDAFYFRKDSGVYAVRFGDFPGKPQARAAAEKLVRDRLISSYYIAPPNEVVFPKPRGPALEKPRPDEISRPPVSRGGEAGGRVAGQQPAAPAGDRDMGYIAARTAERFVGIPYRWGGENVVDGMDCSGFVRAVYNLCGFSIPRTSREQYKTGDPVQKGDLRDGDLVFFGSAEESINHVGIYVGGNRFVHAPRRGEEIRATSIDDGYFERRFVGARRYF